MLFIDQLDRITSEYPDKVAIVDKEKSITFSELRARAISLASEIHKIHPQTKRPIVVETDRLLETIISFFAVIYSGNFYVPIDAAMPRERIETIKKRLESTLGIYHTKNIFEDYALQYEYDHDYGCDEAALERIRAKMIDADPVYVLFTSGTTGEPKGVVISNFMLVDLQDWLYKTLKINENDRLANQTPLFFDASLKELCLFTKTGATLYLMDPKDFLFPVKVVEYLNENKITAILWSVSALNILANSNVFDIDKPKYLRLVTFAGEQMSAQKLNIWRQAVEVEYFNLYGPTEATCDCCYYKVDRDFQDDEIIPIGKACENMEVMILDGDKEADEGELVIRGRGVSYGYYNKLDQTEKAFVQNPLNKAYREIVYRSGDFVRRNNFGEIEFLARKDNQVKVFGHRIELDEIERQVYAMGIHEASAVFDKENEIIILFYSGKEFLRKEFKDFILERLPKYMLPSKFVHMDALPKTQNTKIDKKRLLEIYESGEV